MISNSYSTARMWALTKRYFVENRRNILITLGVMFGLILLFSIVMTKSMYSYDCAARDQERATILWVFYAWFAAIIVQVLGSLTFSSMSTKPKRISNLMLPAAQSEKFVSQCLIYVVGGNAAMLLSFFLADALSAMTFGCVPGWTMIAKFLDLGMLITENPKIIQGAIALWFGILWLYLFGQAIYVIGSALWPKKSFLKTFIALFAIQIALPIIVPFDILTDLLPDFCKWLYSFDNNGIATLLWIAVAIAYALLAGVYFLAWQRFRRLEIVKRFL